MAAGKDDFDRIRRQMDEMRRALQRSGSLDRIRRQTEEIARVMQERGDLDRIRRQTEEINRVMKQSGSLEGIRRQTEAIARVMQESGDLERLTRQLIDAGKLEVVRQELATADAEGLEALADEIRAEQTELDAGSENSVLNILNRIDQAILALLLAAARLATDPASTSPRNKIFDLLTLLLAVRAVLITRS
jgi:hypothetical protein